MRPSILASTTTLVSVAAVYVGVAELIVAIRLSAAGTRIRCACVCCASWPGAWRSVGTAPRTSLAISVCSALIALVGRLALPVARVVAAIRISWPLRCVVSRLVIVIPGTAVEVASVIVSRPL